MATINNYEEGFEEFYLEGVSAESRKRYRAAVSNYYKALTELCGYLVLKKLNKVPKNHTEIFLFLKVSFPDVYEVTNGMFKIYQESYISNKNEEECKKIKDGIRKVVAINEFSEKIKSIVK